MRLLADHCVPEYIVLALRDAGHDVARVVDLADPRASDRQVVELAARMDAVLITADNDFARRGDFQPRRYGGIVLLRDLPETPERAVRRLVRLLARLERGQLKGTLVVLDRRSARAKR